MLAVLFGRPQRFKLSTTMAEYIALSSALRDVTPMMELLKEFANQGYNLILSTPKVYCKDFDHNSEAFEIAHFPKCALIPKQSM